MSECAATISRKQFVGMMRAALGPEALRGLARKVARHPDCRMEVRVRDLVIFPPCNCELRGISGHPAWVGRLHP